MNDFNGKQISSIAAKYLQMIDDNNEKTDEKLDFTKLVAFDMSMRQSDCFRDVSSFRDVINATDVLIQDSGVFNKPEMLFSYRSDGFMKSKDYDISCCDDSNSILGESASSSMFTPPHKRFCDSRRESFIYKLSEPINHSTMTNTFFKPDCTEELFNMKYSRNESIASFANPFIKPVNKIQFQLSSGSSSSQSSLLNEEIFNGESYFKDDQRDAMFSKNPFDQQEEKIIEEICASESKIFNQDEPKIKSMKMDTFYQTPYMVDTEKIEEFYKSQHLDNWKEIVKDVSKIMEPSLEYIAYRYNRLKPITLGNKEETVIIDELEALNSDSFNTSIDDIESTFDKGYFVCSTPEQSISDANLVTNPLDIGFLNLLSVPLQNSEEPKLEERNTTDDQDKTKSFLVNKETENIWSKLTHVSCSVPTPTQEDCEPIFDITTLFEYDYGTSLVDNKALSQNSNGKDVETERYQLLLSILNEYENPFENTSVDLHETIKIAQSRKAALMAQIEMIIQGLIHSLVNQESLIIKFHKAKDWKDCKYESNVLSQKETALKIKSLSFTNKNTKKTFTITVHLLGEIYKLLGTKISCTKRELYYRDVELMQNQFSVNRAIDEICALLNVQCWELGVLSTSKGLVAGDLKVTTEDDEIIDYTVKNSVPQKVSGIKAIESNAEYILVVEKDTVFTRLIEDKIMDKIGTKIILITSKGYPDINTRLLLKKIQTELRKPIYIIVDADAYGIDIMCTYKYGSLQMVNFTEQLAITNMEWIGIHPTDIEKLDITRVELTDADRKKIDELLARPYMNKHLENELNYMKKRGLKAEIESIYHFSIDYLIHDYIPQKIASISNPMDKIIKATNCFSQKIF